MRVSEAYNGPFLRGHLSYTCKFLSVSLFTAYVTLSTLKGTRSIFKMKIIINKTKRKVNSERMHYLQRWVAAGSPFLEAK